jgi:microsomal epoxide hydrolase
MSTKKFGKLPDGASKGIEPFTIDFPEAELKKLKELLQLTPVASPVYENSLAGDDRRLGLRRDWLLKAKKEWETSFDW